MTTEKKEELDLEQLEIAPVIAETELQLELVEDLEDQLTPEDLKSILEEELGVEIKSKKDLVKAKEKFVSIKGKLPETQVQEEFIKRLKELDDNVDIAIQSFGYFDPRRDPSATNRTGEYLITDETIVKNKILEETFLEYQEENGVIIENLKGDEREQSEKEIIDKAQLEFDKLKSNKRKYDRYAFDKRKGLIEEYNAERAKYESETYKKAKEQALDEKKRIDNFRQVSTSAAEMFKAQFNDVNTVHGVKLTQGSVEQIVSFVSNEIREGLFVKNILEGILNRISSDDKTAKEELLEMIIMNHNKIPSTFKENFKKKKQEIGKVEVIKDVALAAKNIQDPAKRQTIQVEDKTQPKEIMSPEERLIRMRESGQSISGYIK